jgi:hypothetical protein
MDDNIITFKIHTNTMHKYGMNEISRMFSMMFALQQSFFKYDDYYELVFMPIEGAQDQMYFHIELNDKKLLEEKLWKEAHKSWWQFW